MNGETARPGLKFIMMRRQAESWDKMVNVTDGVKGFVISEKVKGRSKRQRFFVPMENVEEAERHLSVDSLPSSWVYMELERIVD